MKILILLLALSANAYAHDGEIHEPSSSSTITSQPTAVTGSYRPVASTAQAPSLQQDGICPMITPSSKAASIFIASVSGTSGVTLNPICVAWHLGQKDIVQQMTCNASADYRKASEQVGNLCK